MYSKGCRIQSLCIKKRGQKGLTIGLEVSLIERPRAQTLAVPLILTQRNLVFTCLGHGKIIILWMGPNVVIYILSHSNLHMYTDFWCRPQSSYKKQREDGRVGKGGGLELQLSASSFQYELIFYFINKWRLFIFCIGMV